MFRWLVQGCFSAMCCLRRYYRVTEAAICSPSRTWSTDADCKCTCISPSDGQRRVWNHGFDRVTWGKQSNLTPWDHKKNPQACFVYKGTEGQVWVSSSAQHDILYFSPQRALSFCTSAWMKDLYITEFPNRCTFALTVIWNIQMKHKKLGLSAPSVV